MWTDQDTSGKLDSLATTVEHARDGDAGLNTPDVVRHMRELVRPDKTQVKLKQFDTQIDPDTLHRSSRLDIILVINCALI